MSEQTEPQLLPVFTAFTVVVDQTGKPYAVTELLPDGLQLATLADHRMIKAACLEIADDIQAEFTAARTAALMAPPVHVRQHFDTARLQGRLRERLKDHVDGLASRPAGKDED